MIFITVGTQAPFDRLIKLIDEWAKGQDIKCFAQIANSKYKPKNIEFKTFLTEQEFTAVFEKATLIISHAGMGTIISSLRENKVILTLPRLAKFKEHRNNHQIATTRAFSEKGFIPFIPPIVVNRIHPIVETAKSLLTYNSPQFRSTGREDSDRDTAKVFSDLFQYI